MDLDKKYWLPVVLYAGFIFYLSSIPSSGIETGINLSPIHIPEYFILSYLIFRAASSKEMNPKHALALAIIISTLYGITDEVHQLFVPGRNFSIFDMIFNFIGSSLIIILYRIKRKIR